VPVQQYQGAKKKEKNLDVIYPTVMSDDGVKVLKSVSIFFFSGFRIIGLAPVLIVCMFSKGTTKDYKTNAS
jgi:hypothetical protein